MAEHEMPKHGDFCWTEIAVDDLQKCKNFYSNVFGWTFNRGTASDETMEYPEFTIAGCDYPQGGMYLISQEVVGEGEQLPPPHLLNYIHVDDVDATTSRSFDLGATVIKSPTDIPNVGRFSIIKDPSGAVVSFLTLSGQHQ